MACRNPLLNVAIVLRLLLLILLFDHSSCFLFELEPLQSIKLAQLYLTRNLRLGFSVRQQNQTDFELLTIKQREKRRLLFRLSTSTRENIIRLEFLLAKDAVGGGVGGVQRRKQFDIHCPFLLEHNHYHNINFVLDGQRITVAMDCKQLFAREDAELVFGNNEYPLHELHAELGGGSREFPASFHGTTPLQIREFTADRAEPIENRCMHLQTLIDNPVRIKYVDVPEEAEGGGKVPLPLEEFDENAIGRTRTENAIGGGRAENAIGGTKAEENAIGGTRAENAIGGGKAGNAIGGTGAGNAIGGTKAENAIGGTKAENAIGGMLLPERIEHLEQAIAHWHTVFNRFEHRLKRVELHQRGCASPNGIGQMAPGQRVQNQRDCTECQCGLDAHLHCKPMGCPRLNCTHPVHPVEGTGKCCPECGKRCLYNGVFYESGEMFWPKKCVHCTCNNGRMECAYKFPETCPKLDCVQQETLPNHCCPTCINVDHCEESRSPPCSKDAICESGKHAAVCRCKEGFFGNGTICYDIDECQWDGDARKQLGGCGNGTFCINLPGTFKCECLPGYQKVDAKNCLDVIHY